MKSTIRHSLLLSGLLLGMVATNAGAITPAGGTFGPAASNAARNGATRNNSNGETVEQGVLNSISPGSGVLVVSGRNYRFNVASLAFSDDRKDAEKGGLESLRSGLRVVVRSRPSSSGREAIQLVIKDPRSLK